MIPPSATSRKYCDSGPQRVSEKALRGRLPVMKIAFPTRDDVTISGHFGRMKAVVVVDVVDGRETTRERRHMDDTPACGTAHEDKPRFVTAMISDCDLLVAGGMGTHMRDRAIEANIEVVLTSERLIAKALDRYLDGSLRTEPQLAHQSR